MDLETAKWLKHGQLASKSFKYFNHLINYRQIDNRLQNYVCDKLQAIGEELLYCKANNISRPVHIHYITFAPRHAKSSTTAQTFPAWMFARNPRLNIMQCAFGQDLVDTNSRECRKILVNPTYLKISNGVTLAPDSQRIDIWHTNLGGMFRSAGVGGGIMGMGADLMIIDDPLKGWNFVNSPTTRNTVWNWFTIDVMTRMAPASTIIIIMTRWHSDDIVGRAKANGIEFQSETILPIYSLGDGDPLGRPLGELLCPERFSKEFIEKQRKSLGDAAFSALYMCTPPNQGGTMTHRSRYRMIDFKDLPQDLVTARYWDLAYKTGQDNDFTAGALCGKDKKSNKYIIDISRHKKVWGVIKSIIVDTARRDKALTAIENVGGGEVAFQEVQTILNGIVQLRGIQPRGKKAERAQPWFALAEQGSQDPNAPGVYIVRGPWNTTFFEELEQFPHGEHDDQVDAVSGAFEALETGGSWIKAKY